MQKYSITELCRLLRKNETQSEKLLWLELKGRRFAHFKFRRQHPFIYRNIQGKSSFFIADFYCPKAHLIIELDGKIHEFQKEYDQYRDFVLKQLGLTTIRITNEVLENDMQAVLDELFSFLTKEA
jgi:very-short-patch-repair endonuclease